jgi:hypothetical protein
MCAELLADYDNCHYRSELSDRAHALLDQPVAEGPTDEEIYKLALEGDFLVDVGDGFSCMVQDEVEFARAVLDRWGTPTPGTKALRSALMECGRAAGAFISDECSDEFLLQVPAEVQLAFAKPVWADIHYAWELHDAEGEWQAGGSANSLDDVQREGSRYLQTYSQDGPHKLIIQRHCVNTINEVTQ